MKWRAAVPDQDFAPWGRVLGKSVRTLALVFLVFGSLQCGSSRIAEDTPPVWGAALDRRLGALGRQNWIILAEKSYPVLATRGFQTVVVDAEIPEVLDYLVSYFERSETLKPRFNTARELPHLSNNNAPGIDQFRQDLKDSLHGYPTREADHRLLRRLIARRSKDFSILVIKTSTALPYSNVFIELDTGYWDREFEDQLRARMRKPALSAAVPRQFLADEENEEAGAGPN